MSREQSRAWAMLAPYAVGLAVLIVLPALLTFGLALFRYDLLGSADFRWLGNFADLLRDRDFHRALANSLVFIAIAVPLRLIGALGLALLMHRDFRGAGAGRTAAYLPTVVPDSAYALLWLFLLNPLYGPLNGGLGALGIHTPAWLTVGSSAMAAIILMSCFTIGEGFVVALATRQELPGELYELARLEGSGPLYTLRRVTLPLMAPTLGLLAARDVAFSLQATFVPALLVTQGGPNRATTFLPQLIYENAFQNLRYGYAAAMTLTMFLVTLVIVYVQYRIVGRWRFGFGR
ncbi:MAG: multiple sugar transport system permease protein [Solirubrobacterales bacterium]|jgi:multiple sugar transport system permease protein|nr:multiple sugar transport system permease protein [Solirubrobacterales bacterium]